MQLSQGHVLALPHFPLGPLHQGALRSGEYVVGIGRFSGLDQHASGPRSEGDEIPCSQMEAITQFLGDDDLAPLAQASHRFPPGRGRLAAHDFQNTGVAGIVQTAPYSSIPISSVTRTSVLSSRSTCCSVWAAVQEIRSRFCAAAGRSTGLM